MALRCFKNEAWAFASVGAKDQKLGRLHFFIKEGTKLQLVERNLGVESAKKKRTA